MTPVSPPDTAESAAPGYVLSPFIPDPHYGGYTGEPVCVPERLKMLDRYEDEEPGGRAGRGTGAPALSGPEKPRSIVRRFLPLIILALAAVAVWVLMVSRPQFTPEPVEERVWTVQAQSVVFSDIQPELQVFGEVVAGRLVELRALVAGEILETGRGFREGGIVTRGDMLVTIDPFEYEAARDEAQAQLEQARAQLDEIKAQTVLAGQALQSARDQLVIRQRDLNRAIRLAKGGNISEKTVDDRRLAVSQQKAAVDQGVSNVAVENARVEQQEATISRLEVGLRRAERDLGNTRVTAPFTGFVGEVSAEQGKQVNLNDKLADLTDADRLEASFTLSDAQYGRIIAAEGVVTGRKAKVLWHVGGRKLEYDAIIERVGAQISAASGGVEAFARLKTSGTDTPLRPGAFVEVHLPDTRYEKVAQLPETSLYDGTTVYVIAEGRLEARKVDVAARTAGGILVSGDIKPGEEVLTTRFAEAGPGVRVEER